MKKLIYVFLIPFISLTIISCAKKSSEETNSTTTELEGKWKTICYLDSRDNHYYITTISVTGTNLEIKDEAHHDSSCNTDDFTTVMSNSSLSIGEEVTYSSGVTGHKFTMNFDSVKYTPETAAAVSDLNTNSYCEYSDWALNTEKDITACFSSIILANTTFLNIYKLVGNNLYLGFGTTSYPDSVNNEKAYIKYSTTTDNTTTDDSANITQAILTGTWTAKCSVNTTGLASSKTVLVFSDSGDNLTATTTNYSDKSCVTQSSVFTKKLNTLILGSKTTTSQNQIVYRFTASVTDITLEPKTSPVSTSLNLSSFCGLTGWSSGTETSVAGLTCGSITYNAVNDSHSDIIWMNSEKTFIRLGNITNAASTGYPKTLYTEEYYK